MHRRQFVTTASATIATASIAGCSGILGGGGGGGGSSGPKGAVEAYIDASEDGDTEALEELIHPDGSVSTTTGTSGDMAETTIQSIEVAEEGDSQATVVVSFEITSEEGSATGESSFDVRTHEGEWKIYATNVEFDMNN